MTKAARRFWRPHIGIGALVVFANLLVIGVVALSLQAGYQRYHDEAATLSRNTVRLVALGIAGEIDRVDLALRNAADAAIRSAAGHGEDLEEMLDRQRARLPLIEVMGIENTAGIITHVSGGLSRKGISAAERDYFAALRDNPGLDLAISRPVLGLVSGKWVVILARRIPAADGGFGGVVYASVGIDWFTERFNQLEIGPHGAVVLRGDASRDFDLLTRFPAGGFVGQTRVSDTFKSMIAADPREGTYEARAGADDVLRTFSYLAIGEHPLICLVGFAPEDYLGPWWREAAKLAVLAAIFCLVTVLAGIATLRAWRALERKSVDLARSNADLEQFAYVASHDLQTPLRSVVSYTQLLARRYRGRLDADADDFLDFIVDAGKRMSMIIADLLEYARLSSADRDRQSIDVDDVLAAVMSQLKDVIDECDAHITAPNFPPHVLGDFSQLTSLFQNLIHNALRYRHPDRRPEVTITVAAEGEAMWHFTIRDNGIGIDREYFDKVFVIFQRLDPLRYPGGTGIGLAHCRGIVNRLGGRIWLESEVGQGTTFHFTLPAAPKD